MNDTDMNGGEYLAKTLARYGVSHVFFVDAILRHALAHMEDQGIERILTHSEKAAAYMADGFARIARRPAVCMAQSVGAANLAAGLQDAFFAGSPVLALTGRHIAENQYRNAYQELPHEPFFKEVTKFSARIDAPKQIAHLLQQGFREACSGKSGPVHLDVAGNTGSVMDYWPIAADNVADSDSRSVPAHRPRPGLEALRQAAVKLNEANRPVLIAGIGVHWSQAEEALRMLAESAQIPLATTLDVKHLLPDEHALHAGVVGTYGTDATNRLVAEADLVVFIGCDVGDQATANWLLPVNGTQAIQIDIDAAELGRNLPGAICLHADPRAALNELHGLIKPATRISWLERVKTLRKAWREETHNQRFSDACPIRPERICEEIGAWLPENGILVTDTGYASQWAAQMLPLKSTEQTFLRAAGSLGWGFPASLGAKAAARDRPVICLSGDGGFMYHLPELETACRWKLNTITIVNNNGGLSQGLRNLRLAYDGHPGRMEDCYQFQSTNFAKVAEAFGCIGIEVTHPSQLRAALDAALNCDRPVVIDVRSDPLALAPIPWMPGDRP